MEYTDIAELFPPVRRSVYLTLNQYIFHFPVEEKDLHENRQYAKKFSFMLASLDNPVDDDFNIVNNLLKKTQERNQLE